MVRKSREVPYYVVARAISCEICSASVIAAMFDQLQEKQQKGRNILRLHEKVSSALSMPFHMCGFSRLETGNQKRQELIHGSDVWVREMAITIIPTVFSLEVRCDNSKYPQYEALSYVWGGSPGPNTTVLRNQHVHVTSNLESALR